MALGLTAIFIIKIVGTSNQRWKSKALLIVFPFDLMRYV